MHWLKQFTLLSLIFSVITPAFAQAVAVPTNNLNNNPAIQQILEQQQQIQQQSVQRMQQSNASGLAAQAQTQEMQNQTPNEQSLSKPAPTTSPTSTNFPPAMDIQSQQNPNQYQGMHQPGQTGYPQPGSSGYGYYGYPRQGPYPYTHAYVNPNNPTGQPYNPNPYAQAARVNPWAESANTNPWAKAARINPWKPVPPPAAPPHAISTSQSNTNSQTGTGSTTTTNIYLPPGAQPNVQVNPYR